MVVGYRLSCGLDSWITILIRYPSASSVRCAQIVQGRGSPATAVDIAGDNDNVVVGAEDGSCLLYNIKTAQVCVFCVAAGCWAIQMLLNFSFARQRIVCLCAPKIRCWTRGSRTRPTADRQRFVHGIQRLCCQGKGGWWW